MLRYFGSYNSYLFKNMNKSLLLCIVVLLTTSYGFTVEEENIVTADDRVKIDFYYESLCPYCQQFIERSLKTAANTKVNRL